MEKNIDDPAVAEQADESDKPLGKGYATASQIKKIWSLFTECFSDAVRSEKMAAALKSRGVTAVRSLAKDKAQEMIDRLEAMKKQAEAAAPEPAPKN